MRIQPEDPTPLEDQSTEIDHTTSTTTSAGGSLLYPQADKLSSSAKRLLVRRMVQSYTFLTKGAVRLQPLDGHNAPIVWSFLSLESMARTMSLFPHSLTANSPNEKAVVEQVEK